MAAFLPWRNTCLYGLFQRNQWVAESDSATVATSFQVFLPQKCFFRKKLANAFEIHMEIFFFSQAIASLSHEGELLWAEEQVGAVCKNLCPFLIVRCLRTGEFISLSSHKAQASVSTQHGKTDLPPRLLTLLSKITGSVSAGSNSSVAVVEGATWHILAQTSRLA